MIKKIRRIFLGLLACSALAYAYDMRVWEDVNGKQYTGRFVRELFGKLTIEDNEGNQTTFEIEDLSDKDKKYVRVMIPPKIEVVVRTKSKRLDPRPMDLWRDDVEILNTVSATITKESQRPFTSRLKAEMFLISEEFEGDNYILMARYEDDFLLLEEKEYTYEFRGKPVKTTLFTDIGSQDRKGEVFKGHVLIITSMQGDVLTVDSNLPKWMQEPQFLEKMRELAVRGAPTLRSRHFNKEGDKVPPPRPQSCSERTT